jgi:rubrerythrin
MNNKYLTQLQTEVNTSFLYNAFADHTSDKTISELFRKMAEIEKGHANKLMAKIKQAGLNMQMPGASFNERTQIGLQVFLGMDLNCQD